MQLVQKIRGGIPPSPVTGVTKYTTVTIELMKLTEQYDAQLKCLEAHLPTFTLDAHATHHLVSEESVQRSANKIADVFPADPS